MTRDFRKLVGATVGLGLATASATVYASLVEPRQLRVRRARVTVAALPEDLEGLRIAFLTDFHAGGPGRSGQLTRQAIDLIVAEQPDLVLLGGDYYDEGDWLRDPAAFDGLSSASQVFGVFGNHDLRLGEQTAQDISELLTSRGVCPLRNTAVSVSVRGRNVVIAGVDDPYTGKADLAAALGHVPNGERPLFLLAHAPTIVDELPVGGIGLVVCGHTHGGQIRLSPFQHVTPLDSSWYLDRVLDKPLSRCQRGFFWVRGNLVFVGNGIGVTRWPVRFLAPPEVVLIELSREPQDPSAACDSPRRYVRDSGWTLAPPQTGKIAACRRTGHSVEGGAPSDARSTGSDPRH